MTAAENLRLRKELEINALELEILQDKYDKLTEGVERAALVLANCAQEIALKTYLDDLKANGATMRLMYKDNAITFGEMTGIMLSACIETWQEHLEDE